MKDRPRKHIVSLLARFLEASRSRPVKLEPFLNSFVKENESLGPGHLSFVSDNLYNLIRNLELVKHLSGNSNPTPEDYLSSFLSHDLAKYRRDRSLPPHIRFSIHPSLFERVERSLGPEESLKFGEVSCQRAPLTIRANPLRVSPSQLAKLLSSSYSISTEPCLKALNGLKVIGHPPVISSGLLVSDRRVQGRAFRDPRRRGSVDRRPAT